LTQLKAFWKFRRNVCSQKRLYRAKFAGIDATTHRKHRPQKLLKEAALPGTNRTVADGLQMVDIFSKMVVITGVNSGCGSIGRRICSQDNELDLRPIAFSCKSDQNLHGVLRVDFGPQQRDGCF
jgi:FlaA1/EpsC-like NDP-sugar epimerase